MADPRYADSPPCAECSGNNWGRRSIESGNGMRIALGVQTCLDCGYQPGNEAQARARAERRKEPHPHG